MKHANTKTKHYRVLYSECFCKDKAEKHACHHRMISLSHPHVFLNLCKLGAMNFEFNFECT